MAYYFNDHYPDLPPGATEEEAREWWEGFRKQENEFAEKYNKDWLNRLFGRRIDLVPSFDEVMESMNKKEGDI